MIQDTVKAVIEAEKQAAEITKAASEEGKIIVANAEKEAEKLRISTVNEVKEERKKVVASAEEEGEKEYEKIILAGKAQAAKLSEGVKLDKAIEFIKEKISVYGNR